jgi:hypothetical protein
MAIHKRSAGVPNRALIGRATSAGMPKYLPLIHITLTGFAREIIAAGQLEPRPCSALQQDLLYFFALRPAYGKKTDDAKSDQIGRFPAILIIDPANLGPPHHVYPFDTGGALDGVFGDTPNPTVFLEDYELAPTLAAAAEQIAWAFGTRRAYFRGNVLDYLPEHLPQFDEVARSFISIARLASSIHKAPDRRASSIEIAYRRIVRLKEHCPLIVLPKQYLEDGSHNNVMFIDRIRQQNIAVRTYDWQPNYCPIDYRDMLSRIVEDYLDDAGAFDD